MQNKEVSRGLLATIVVQILVFNLSVVVSKVTWLACWVENIAGNYKYVMLNSATKLKVR